MDGTTGNGWCIALPDLSPDAWGASYLSPPMNTMNNVPHASDSLGDALGFFRSVFQVSIATASDLFSTPAAELNRHLCPLLSGASATSTEPQQ